MIVVHPAMSIVANLNTKPAMNVMEQERRKNEYILDVYLWVMFSYILSMVADFQTEDIDYNSNISRQVKRIT